MTLEEMQKEIQALKQEVLNLKNNTTIPFETERAFRERFGLANYAVLAGSTKTPSSENQSVNEGGVATYNVLKAPDGFREFTTGGTTFYFPYYL